MPTGTGAVEALHLGPRANHYASASSAAQSSSPQTIKPDPPRARNTPGACRPLLQGGSHSGAGAALTAAARVRAPAFSLSDQPSRVWRDTRHGPDADRAESPPPADRGARWRHRPGLPSPTSRTTISPKKRGGGGPRPRRRPERGGGISRSGVRHGVWARGCSPVEQEAQAGRWDSLGPEAGSARTSSQVGGIEAASAKASGAESAMEKGQMRALAVGAGAPARHARRRSDGRDSARAACRRSRPRSQCRGGLKGSISDLQAGCDAVWHCKPAAIACNACSGG